MPTTERLLCFRSLNLHLPLRAASLLALFALAAACGGSAPSSCEACPGCCLDGVCLQPNDSACGQGGQACVQCPAGTACEQGACQPTTTPCADRCPTGCCLGETCEVGTFDHACGQGGASCATCSQVGMSCDTFSRQCVDATPCGPNNCAGCCDVTGRCINPPADTACGLGGNACLSCDVGKRCIQGSCQRTSTTCSSATCSGCCSTEGVCLGPATFTSTACGWGGGACEDCTKNNQVCEGGYCVAPAGTFMLRVIRAIVDATDSSGGAWDTLVPSAYAYPDPFVGAILLGDYIVDGYTSVIDDTVFPSWNEDLVRYTASELINGTTLRVFDSDSGIQLGERMGDCIFQLTPFSGVYALTRGAGNCDGSVVLLEVELVRDI